MAVGPRDLLFSRVAVNSWESYIDGALRRAKLEERPDAWRVSPPVSMWGTMPTLGKFELEELCRRYVAAGWKSVELVELEPSSTYPDRRRCFIFKEGASDIDKKIPAVAPGSKDVPE